MWREMKGKGVRDGKREGGSEKEMYN